MHNKERDPAPLSRLELKTTIRAEQIRALYHAPAIMLVNPINASILAVVLWQDYPAWILLVWIGLFCVVVSVRFVDRIRYLRHHRENGDEVAWARRFTVGAAVTGVLWGLAGSVVFVAPDPLAHVVVTFVLGGMTVGAVFQQSAYLPALFQFCATGNRSTSRLLFGEGRSNFDCDGPDAGGLCRGCCIDGTLHQPLDRGKLTTETRPSRLSATQRVINHSQRAVRRVH